MWRLFKKTLLFKRFMEVKEAYSSLRQTQFRSGLRLKRLAVQSRVFAEIAQLHLERIQLTKEAAMAMSNLSIIGKELCVRQSKLDRLIQMIAQRKEKLPPQLVRIHADVAKSLREHDIVTNETSEQTSHFQKDMINRIQHLVPEGVTSLGTRQLLTSTLEDSMEKLTFNNSDNEMESASKLISSMVKEMNLSDKQVEEILSQVDASGKNSDLRSFVGSALDGPDPKKKESVADKES